MKDVFVAEALGIHPPKKGHRHHNYLHCKKLEVDLTLKVISVAVCIHPAPDGGLPPFARV